MSVLHRAGKRKESGTSKEGSRSSTHCSHGGNDGGRVLEKVRKGPDIQGPSSFPELWATLQQMASPVESSVSHRPTECSGSQHPGLLTG